MSKSFVDKSTAFAAEWLSDEIFSSLRNLGAGLEASERLGRLTRALTEKIGENSETHLEIETAGDRKFLKSAIADEHCGLVIGSPQSFLEGKTTPLIFAEKNSALYFLRHYKQELQTVQKVFEKMAKNLVVKDNFTAIEEAIISADEPFPLNAEQQAAIRAVLSSYFTIISGGPGTGKTTLLLRVLLCIFTKNPNAKITLAAPTGKAAARMKESIQKQVEEILKNPKAREVFPAAALQKTGSLDGMTLHRILGLSGNALSNYPCRKLDSDFVIIDEASMIDQVMMHRLLRSLEEETRLVLLGDKNQLESVGPGQVFGAFCSAENLKSARVELVESRRFSENGVIGRLARAVVVGDAGSVQRLLSEDLEGKGFVFSSKKITSAGLDAALKRLFPEKLKCVPEDADAGEMLALLDSSRLLTPLKNGDFGTAALNARSVRLFAFGRIPGQSNYHGQPIVITRNAPQEGLFNGDVGIVLKDTETKTLFAYFRRNDGTLKRIQASVLPEHETCYAMSIHKSQGSEFSRLCIVFPPVGAYPEFFSRQLLYTAITRFREGGENSHFQILFDLPNLLEAVKREIPQKSLLFKDRE